MCLPIISELLLNVRSGVQHLADKLDFVDGKVDPDSVPDSPVPASDQPDDIIKQISHILSRSGNYIFKKTIERDCKTNISDNLPF